MSRFLQFLGAPSARAIRPAAPRTCSEAGRVSEPLGLSRKLGGKTILVPVPFTLKKGSSGEPLYVRRASKIQAGRFEQSPRRFYLIA
ncbi:MAG: hypothetical protein HOW73_31020 [Polyangiaceae bacterium]|nr:hypothetical protein [Polyangiaceae bacterium]